MDLRSNESAHHGYASELVPESAQGSGWRVFFIVAGSQCGLSCFILSARIFGGMGFTEGLLAVVVGGAIAGILGACSAFTGSRSRMGLAMLADHTFGHTGSRIVKVVIAIALVGWFGVIISVVGETAALALSQMSGHRVPPLAIALPISAGIALMTLSGATGLERLGKLLVPATALVLGLSAFLVSSKLGRVWGTNGSGSLDFASGVSAIVGTYIVGIVIQPDYGRFVRLPSSAAAGAGIALSVAFPLILVFASLASLALGAPQLISAMVLLGFGLPALAILLLGAWIDASACLYSATLSFANQMPRVGFATIVLTTTLIGVTLVLMGAETVFIPFLVTLGIALPPLATVLILGYFLLPDQTRGAMSALMLACWLVGTSLGFMTTHSQFKLTGLPALNSIIASAIAFGVVRLLRGHAATLAA